ncbi:MAG: hypothetical protein M3253_03860 [Chloroflexota bacterium]|nr:hypothetical protein [Chloroflexota bacterium]
MPDSPIDDDTPDDIGVDPDSGSTTGTPRWVKVSGIITLAVVVLFVVLLLAGRGGDHGPGRHSSGGADGQTPSATVRQGHKPPTGAHTRP